MLNVECLEKVRQSGQKLTARCPACHEIGADRSGQHLVYWPDTGRFACAANPGDKPHRQRIWQLIGVPDDRTESFRPSRAERTRRQEEAAHARHRDALAAAARRDASRIFTMDWDPADIWHDSSVILDGRDPGWHLLLAALFPPDAAIWIGEPKDSGPGHELHFQCWPEWFKRSPAAPPFAMTCPDIFHPGSFSRCAASVHSSPFLVVEADEAIGHKPASTEERAENIRRNLCILHWLKTELNWSLRAIIHTGGKSCHGWFDRPPEPHIRELKAIAPALGIDFSVFCPAHPVRLPGVRHQSTGALSRLMYLNA